MYFEISYRKSNGSLAKETIEAVDRSAAFSALKARGVTPIAVHEVKKPAISKSAEHANGTISAGVKYGILAAILVVACGVAWFCLSGGDSEEKKPVKKAEAPKPPPPKPAKKTPAPQPSASTNVVAAPAPKAAKAAPEVQKTADGKEIYTDSQGRKIYVLNPRDPEAEKNAPKPLFRHEVESALAMYVKPGIDMPPPPRDYTDDEVVQALISPITIDPENDSEDDQYAKKTVQAMKDELKQFLAEGGTFNGYLRQLQQRQRNEALLINESKQMVVKSIKEGKMDEAKELMEKLNKHLNDKGIPSVKLPPPYRKQMEAKFGKQAE